MKTIPQELNWVEKRGSCTVGKVFNQLCDAIKEDVASINSIRKLDEVTHFLSGMHSDGSTLIVGQPNQLPRSRVLIGAVEDRIVVRQERPSKEWKATPGLNLEGRCILRLEDGTELEQWQFRKLALESLFFGD